MDSGKFIVLEGIDGAGTSTQAARLAAWIQEQGKPVHLTSEPSAGAIGKVIRQWLADPPPEPGAGLLPHALALLFAADRLEHLAREVEPQLAAGVHVVSDRYLLSSLAYQSLDCDYDWVAELNREARPADLTILLDLPAELAMKRAAQRAKKPELFEKLEVQEKVRRLYLEAVRRLSADQPVVVLDGGASIAEVFQAVVKTVKPVLG